MISKWPDARPELRSRPSHHEPPPDDLTRLINLLVAICGDQINSCRPKIEALVARLNANARFVKTRQDGGQKERSMSRCGSASMLGGRRSAGADRSQAQLPAAQRTRKAEAVSKRNGPAIFAQAGPFFISSKLRRTANQVTALQAVARPTQPKLRPTDSRYCGSLTRSPAGSGLYSGNSLLSADSRAPFSDMGVLLKEHRGI